MARKKNDDDITLTCPLEPKNCYVGQRVYWIMWCDPVSRRGSGNHEGSFAYSLGSVPEIWSAVIERLTRNGRIMLEEYGQAKVGVYRCEQDAITGTYEQFCRIYLCGWNWRKKPRAPLGIASVVLRHLAKLEFDLNDAVAGRSEGGKIHSVYKLQGNA